MSANRHRHSNSLQIGSMLLWAIVAAFFIVTGISYLYLKNQLYVAGARKKALERELRDLTAQNQVLDSQIAALTSRSALQQRLKEGFIKMVEIPSTSIVRLHLLPETATHGLAEDAHGGTDQLRTIAHNEDQVSLRAGR